MHERVLLHGAGVLEAGFGVYLRAFTGGGHALPSGHACTMRVLIVPVCAGVLEAGFGEYLRAFTDGPSLAELLDREGGRRQPFLRRSLPPAVRAPVAGLGFFDVFQQDACGFLGLPFLRRSLPPAVRAPSRGLQGRFGGREPRG